MIARHRWLAVLILIISMVAGGCGGGTSAPPSTGVAATSPPQATIAPTLTFTPTAEPTPEPTASPTASPTPEPTPTPMITAVPFDLGDAVLVQEWITIERIREMPIRLNGMIALPPTGDALPLAVVIHGSHGSGCASPDGMTEEWPCPEDEARHYEGFVYLLEALARRGYVALAINANPIYVMAYGEANTPLRSPILFDLYMEQVAAAANGEGVDLGVDLAGRVDWNRLAVLGHSQGGAAVSTIMNLRADQTSSEQVRAGQGPLSAAVLLAPADDGDRQAQLTAPTAIILPACDRDLVGLGGQGYYERARMRPELDVTVSSVLLQWANHNRFNATLEDEWLGRGTAVCTLESLLPAEAQQRFLEEYVPRFFDFALGIGKDEAHLIGLDPTQPAPAALFEREVLTSLALPSAQRLRLPLDAARTSGSAAATYCPEGFGDAESRDPACRRMELNQPGSPDEWVLSWEGADGAYAVTVPDGSWDLSGYATLHLRAVVDPLSELNPEGQPQAFSLRLTDGSGATAHVSLDGEPALAYPYGATIVFEDQPDQVLWDNGLLLSSIRVPLAEFAGVDRADIRSVILAFDQTASGAMFITDLELLRE